MVYSIYQKSDAKIEQSQGSDEIASNIYFILEMKIKYLSKPSFHLMTKVMST